MGPQPSVNSLSSSLLDSCGVNRKEERETDREEEEEEEEEEMCIRAEQH